MHGNPCQTVPDIGAGAAHSFTIDILLFFDICTWCSAGHQAAGQSVTWTGHLHARQLALGVVSKWSVF